MMKYEAVIGLEVHVESALRFMLSCLRIVSFFVPVRTGLCMSPMSIPVRFV